VQGDDGPHLGEGGDAVDDPDSTRAGGGARMASVIVKSNQVESVWPLRKVSADSASKISFFGETKKVFDDGPFSFLYVFEGPAHAQEDLP
jgi:hypothetical protein